MGRDGCILTQLYRRAGGDHNTPDAVSPVKGSFEVRAEAARDPSADILPPGH